MSILTIQYDAEKLISEIMQNYPEASASYLQCTSWHYKECRFTFQDMETGCAYKLDKPRLVGALETMLNDMFTKNALPGIRKYVMRDFTDAGNWDAEATDALVQYAIFGKVIYG